MEIGRRLRELREAHGIGRRELAESLGVSPEEISLWESGAGEPPPGEARRLREILKKGRLVVQLGLFEEL